MKNQKTAAVISSSTLGDGLLMLIAANHLQKAGYKVTFFHRLMGSMSSFFDGIEFQDHPKNSDPLKKYDLVILEYINPLVFSTYEKLKSELQNLHIFYPRKIKDSFDANEYLFNSNHSMGTNITRTMEKILNLKGLEKSNGLKAAKSLQHKKYPLRVIFHPLSNDPLKNWQKKKYLSLYRNLRLLGYRPIFVMAEHEKATWKHDPVEMITFKTYFDLACFIFESGFLIGNDSGPAHLASNLNIQTIVVTGNIRKMKLWQPDFYPSKLVLPPSFLPNFKGLRLKDHHWPKIISRQKVQKTFLKEIKKVNV